MSSRLVVLFASVLLFAAVVSGTTRAAEGAGTGPHVAWKAVAPSVSSSSSGVAYGSGNVFLGYCVVAGVGFAAYDAATGAMKWNNTNLLDQGYGCNYPPLYHSGTVYAVGGYSAVAFDASTGAVLWTQTNNLSNANGVIAYDSLNGNIVFVANGDGFVVSALDASTGAIRWQHTLTGWQSAESPTSIAVGDGHVYVPNVNGTLAALRADTGVLDWAVNVASDGGDLGPVATACGVLVVTGYSEGKVFGLNPATGATQWMVTTNTNWQAPAVDKDSCTAYFTTFDGAAAIAVLSGTITWQVTNRDGSFSMPAVAGGRFWEVSYTSNSKPAAVLTRNATTGALTGSLPLTVPFRSNYASRVTATSTDGTMFFFALSDLTLYGVSAATDSVRVTARGQRTSP